MRLLFVVPYVPSRIRVRPYEFIRALSPHHHVEVVCLVTSAHEVADLELLRHECAAVHPIAHPLPYAALQTMRGALRGLPLQVAYATSSALARTVERLAPHFDVVHLEHLRGTGISFNTGNVPVVWDAVDCISLLAQEMRRASQPLRVRAVRWIDRTRTAHYEARMLQRFAHIVVTAERDAAALWDLHGAGEMHLSVIPNGVDLEYFRPSPRPDTSHEVVFVGKMSYHANIAAVREFVHHIWPQIHETIPDARFTVVGAAPPRDISRLNGNAGITVTGRVPDVRPYLARAAVAVAPLVYSVGNPNKVLEAMAMMVPIIATPTAVTAIRAGHNTGIVVAERDAFASEVIRLLMHPKVGIALGHAGRRHVEIHHTWRRAATQLETVYRAACGEPEQWYATAAD